MNLLQKIKINIEILFFIFLYKSNNKSRNENLLFINTGQIGDLVVSSLLFENQEFLGKFNKVYFLMKNSYLEIFKNYNGKIELINFEYSKYKYSIPYKLKFLKMIRELHINISINLTADRGIINEELTHLANANETIALNKRKKYLGRFWGFYFDKKYSRFIGLDKFNEYEKHIDLLKYFDNGREIVFTDNIFDNDKNILKNMYLNSIIIAPFSSINNRDWQHEKFKKIISTLNSKYHIVLLGSKEQEKSLLELKGTNQGVSILAGELKLNEIPRIIKASRLFIGLDSGMTHIALKVGVPLVAIIGGGQFGRFFPFKESNKVKYLYHQLDCFGCEWQCKLESKFCIENVSVEEVLNAIEKIMSEIVSDKD